MENFPPTLILRHRKENLKKCSLRGLEQRPDMVFYSYPLKAPLPATDRYLLLALDGPPLSLADSDYGLLLIDGTWRYAAQMEATTQGLPLNKRSLPADFVTAYPRCQTECSDPARGLASVEALYIAYALMGRPTVGLLDNYYWAEAFLQKNGSKILR